MKKKKFIILIIIICAGLIIWYFNTFTIKTNYEIIESEKIVDEITIIQISDLHGSLFGRNNKELIKKIEKETGLVRKAVLDEQNVTREYEFENVDDSIFIEPDISQYTLKEND